MTLAFAYVGGSITALVVLALLFRIEDAYGSRVILSGARAHLDTFCAYVYNRLFSRSVFLKDGFVRLVLHYGAHSLLRTILRIVRSMEVRLENLLRQNRMKARELSGKKDRNHLDEIADHKAESSLTEKEKEKMRAH